MRRPIRIKDKDYNVPMLTEDDFEIIPIPEHIAMVPRECALARDMVAQRELAQMCIAKAKLCLCIGHVLSTQYSVLVESHGLQDQDRSSGSRAMLFPKKLGRTDEVQGCDLELSHWTTELPISCQYSNKIGIGNSATAIFVNRALLNMVYFTTVSALHRPQVYPAGIQQIPDNSLRKVREASREITRISQDLHARNLERYLPTTGVTVLLAAIVIYLLDIKSSNDKVRQAAIEGLCHCMLILEKLRDSYAFATFATLFLLAVIRKANINFMISSREKLRQENPPTALSMDKVNEMCRRSSPLGVDHSTEQDLHRSRMVDIRIPINGADDFPTIISTCSSGNEIIVSGPEFTSVPNLDVNINEILNLRQ
jgi:hypothetical protein